MPTYLRTWLDGICGTARAANKIGLVVWTEPGKRDDSALVVLTLADWIDLHGNPCEGEGGTDV